MAHLIAEKPSNSKFTLLYFLLSCCLFMACSEEETKQIPKDPGFEQDFPIEYNAVLPDGKLPYPHQDPISTQEDYDSLIHEIFIINNFGLYQCGDTPEQCYFHDGLDFVLPNGTPIFALEEGIVRANIGGNSYYRTLVVEDKDEPGYAWSYTHVYNFSVSTGDEVSQGQYLGKVNFQGLEHIHLSRSKLKEGGSWSNFGDLINIYPDDYFTFIDETSPTIKTPFHYFPNNSDSVFGSEGGVTTVSGTVDIVVSMRDAGAYAADYIGTSGYWGNRLAVRDISYRILKDDVEVLRRKSYDFRNLEFVFSQDRWMETLTVFKDKNVLDPDAGTNNMFHSHYIITNARENYQGEINPQDGNLAWNTLELNSSEERVYPNGLYTIEVTAHDSNGNASTKRDEVYVDN